MPGNRPFKFNNRNTSNSSQGSNPKPGRDLKNEWSMQDGKFYLSVRLDKAAGYIESGIINKKKLFNARLSIKAAGGEIVSLSAVYQTSSGDRAIKQINEKCFQAEFDVPTEQFVGTHLKVTVECKFKLGVFKRKCMRVSVFLPH